jgi:molybdate transport system substrate-binding protein
MKLKRLTLIFVLILFSLPWQTVQAQDSQTLMVFAAASLTDAFEDMATTFESEHPGVDVVFNFGGSSALATQLSEGAPADVFASANTKQMGAARDAGRIDGPAHTFAKNRLVVIVPSDNPANIQSLHDLANSGILLVIAAPDVPVRDYTDTMLERLAAVPGYGEDYSQAVMANVVSEESDVRQVVAKVALGEADAGVVYLSDVTPDIASEVVTIAIPDAYNTIATYPIALTNDTAQPELAQAFIDYVLSDAGQDILVSWGFISIRIPELPTTITLPTDGALHVEGQIFNPLALTADDLQANYVSQTVDVTYLSGEDTVSTSYTGVLLWDILSSAQVNFNADVKNDKVSMFLVASGSDGYQAVVSWAEIDPEYSNQPILVAYQEADQPIADGFVLVVPGDGRGSRYVKGLVSLSVRDAPIAE